MPVIDVGEWLAQAETGELGRLAAELRTAPEQVGFHQLVGHGLDPTLTAGVLERARRFDASPSN